MDQTKIQVVLHEISPTNPYRNLCSRCETHWCIWFGLRYITIAYQSADLGLNHPSGSFTNHYHRGLGQGIDMGVEGSVVVGASVVATWAVW